MARHTWRGDAVCFVVRLTPRGGRDAIDGWRDGADGTPQLHARVAVPPEDGKANAALIALLAKTLKVPKTTLEIVAGASARTKTIAIHSPAPDAVCRLEQIGVRQ